MTFPGRIAAPLDHSPGRWRNFSAYIAFIAEHFNDAPRFAAPEPAWAAGGEPLDSRAAREGLKWQRRCFRKRMHAERAARTAAKQAEHERAKQIERAERARLFPKSEATLRNLLRTDVLAFGRAWEERKCDATALG